ncbi:MAG: DUF4190 domain-containing protein [Phycisphaerales bacterium]|nr:DUF4190 domain-containing protein [Phycisphaerales bacterium]
MEDNRKQLAALEQTVGVRTPVSKAGGTGGGRRYGFLCTYCSSRLEATESVAGQSGTCPTCGMGIVIPILDSRGRLIDPTSGEVLKQDPHPVHAYAAAGHKAPQIITHDNSGKQYILCPRCQRQNILASNNCLGCGLPFTMEGTTGDSISGTNSWAVASLVLGIVSVAGGCIAVVPPILAIVFGIIAMRNAASQSRGQGIALAGVILGTLALLASSVFIFGLWRP